MARSIALAALLYALPIAAKTDLEGCTSFTSTVVVRPTPGYGNTYETVIWYVPDTLELCKGVDCGGGRAPPRSVPGCPIYKGTETVTPEFLDHDPMAPKTVDKASKATTAPTVTSEAEAEETTSEEIETLSTDELQPTATTTASEVGTKKEEPKTTAIVSKSIHKSNGTMTQTSGAEKTTSKGEEAPTTSAVTQNAGAGVMVKAASVLAGVVGVIALML
ncbi:siderophore biosynthesis protein [Fusarium austroafricanum]|uniref:Siderophore biosynthesis protein n=1 Tax=Fusarium austroafricanum TaxID=2364996 RepID=A0A8H4P0A7_9HYPO|nr:siderophore biosynthesis protein [Fusarium austroafricanum]